MSKIKSRLRQAVTSSTINRASLEDTFIQQSSEAPSYAPFDDPNNIPSNSDKGNIDFKYLSKTEFSVLKALSDMVSANNDGITNPVYLDQFSESLGSPVSTLKKVIQKLEKKKMIARNEYKSGRGGWTCYKVPLSIRDKLETN